MIRAVSTCLLLTLIGGCGMPSFLVTPVPTTYALHEETVVPGQGWGAGKVAIIEVSGMLLNARASGLLQAGENNVSRFAQELAMAEKDPAVKAVVLRVNSPGGTVTASDIMYETLLRFKERTKKPVVAALQDVAASGAYYISCGADRIVAHPTSVVGSIGVIFNTFNFEGTLDKIGAKSEAIKSGPLKDMGSPFRQLDPASRAVMQGMVDEYYKRFVTIVTTHRPMKDSEKVKLVTDGRVFSGARAAELGLADRTGILEDAIEDARQLGGAAGAKVIVYKRPYGYTGSIYAQADVPQPQASVMELKIPGLHDPLPTGFYYLWNP